MTRQQLIDLAASCEPRDFFGFADLVIRRDPVLGATVYLHAEAADGNSPDLRGWVEGTMADQEGLEAADIETPTAARAWWMREYAGGQDEWPGSEQDPDWCYVCDRPGDDCACQEEAIDLDAAREYVASHEDDDDMDEDELAEVFVQVYGRKPDAKDRRDGVWSLICAGACELDPNGPEGK